MAINVDLVADASKAIREAGKLGDALGSVADDLDSVGHAGKTVDAQVNDAFRDMSKDAKTAGRSISDGVGDGMKDAGKAAGHLDDKAADTFRAMGKEAKAAGDKVGKSQKDGFKEAESGVAEFGDEANSTAKETAASFDGSADSILGAFQEVAANAFAGFGPAGAVAGLAIAAGIGLAVAQMQAGAEAANEMKAASVDLAGQIVDAGGDIRDVDLGGIISAWGRQTMDDNWVTVWTNEASTKFQETAKDAKTAGVDMGDAVRAAAGSADDSRKFLDATGDAWQKLSEKIQEGTTYTNEGIPVQDASAQAAQAQRDALSDLRGQAEANVKTTGDAVEIAKIENDVTGQGTAAIEAQTKALEDKARALSDASGNAMDSVTAEIAYNDAMDQGATDIANNGKGLDLHTAAGKANQQTLVDMAKSANDLRDAQVNAGGSTAAITAKTEEARGKFVAAAVAAGMTKDAAGKLADQYGLVPKNVDTYVKAHDVEKTKGQLNGLGAPVNVPVSPYMDAGAKFRYQMEMAQLTAQRQQTILVQKLTNGVPLP